MLDDASAVERVDASEVSAKARGVDARRGALGESREGEGEFRGESDDRGVRVGVDVDDVADRGGVVEHRARGWRIETRRRRARWTTPRAARWRAAPRAGGIRASERSARTRRGARRRASRRGARARRVARGRWRSVREVRGRDRTGLRARVRGPSAPSDPADVSSDVRRHRRDRAGPPTSSLAGSGGGRRLSDLVSVSPRRACQS